MAETMLNGPEGYHLLRGIPRIYYRIEEDGTVTLTGDLPGNNPVGLDKVLHDGSKLRGNASMRMGKLRINGFRESRNRTYPIRWVKLEGRKTMRKKVEVYPEDWVTKSSFTQLEKEADKLRSQVESLKEKFESLSEAAKTEINRLKDEYRRRVTARTVILEATIANSDQIEGHKVETWEVGEKQYLVIAESPAGLQGSWASDIRDEIRRRMPHADTIGVCLLPKGAAVKVVEILPTGDAPGDDVGQF